MFPFDICISAAKHVKKRTRGKTPKRIKQTEMTEKKRRNKNAYHVNFKLADVKILTRGTEFTRIKNTLKFAAFFHTQ